MKVGIIGSGNIGGTLAGLLTRAGHEVMLSNSRGPQTLTGLAAQTGAAAGTVEQAAAFGEVVIEAVPFSRYDAVPADELAGKILVSAANYYPQRDGQIDLGGRTETAFLAAHVPAARVVKGFNAIWYQHLATQGDVSKPVEDRRAIFIAGDDADAKRVVAELIESIGFGAVDTGDLAGSAVQQPGAAIYNRDMTVREGRAAMG